MGSRRRARHLAFLSIYQADVLDESTGERLVRLLDEEGADGGEAEFAGDVVGLYARHRAAVDRAIREAGASWELERMSATDRAVLREAVTELLFVADVPVAVTLNEAIEIARDYGGEVSGRFVNGVLDAVRRRVEAAAAEPPADGEDGNPCGGVDPGPDCDPARQA